MLKKSEKGFTLLEILLVIVIVSLSAAMVIPSFVNVNHGDVREESRRLQQVLRLVSEESQLTGTPMRWVARKHEYAFEVLNQQQEWTILSAPPFGSYILPEGVLIADVIKTGQENTLFLPETNEDTQAEDSQTKEKNKKDPVVERVIFWPDGMLTPAEVVLSEDVDDEGLMKRIELRPGLGGIRVMQEDVSL